MSDDPPIVADSYRTPTGPDGGLAEHLWGLVNDLRGLSSRGADPYLALAVNAAVTIAARRGIPPPQFAVGATSAESEMAPVLSRETEWLRRAPDEWVPAYLPALARALAAIDQPGRRERITSSALVEVASTIVSARPPVSEGDALRMYDPAAGTGSLVLQVGEALAPAAFTIAAQDINQDMVAIGTANAFLAGVEARFVLSDSLARDAFEGEGFDIAISDPPYGMSWSRQADALAGDPRYQGGLPRQSDSSLLFAQILAAKLRPASEGGGRAVVFCAPGPLVEPSGSGIREWFLEQDLVEAVVALPEGLSSETSIRLFALVLNSAKDSAWKGKIQVVDLRGSFVDARGGRRPERRRLSEKGLSELRRALERPLPSALARPVEVDRFRFEKVDVVHPALASHGCGRGRSSTFSAWISTGDSVDAWAAERYAIGARPEVAIRDGASEVRFDISTAFPDPTDREVSNEVRRLGWSHTRLPCLALTITLILSSKSEEREAQISALPPRDSFLVVPVEPHVDALVTESLDSAPPNRCLVVDLENRDDVDAEFVAAWLNSPGGRTARRSAVNRVAGSSLGHTPTVRSLSRAQVSEFSDTIIVPVPPLGLQRQIVHTTAALASTASAVAAGSRDLWQSPTNAQGVRRRIQLPTEARDLAEWAARLPYPLAGALWVFETEKHDPLRAQEHLLRFWEATAEFIGVLLLSALDSDPVLREVEFSKLRTTLEKARLSLERATFGTWVTVVQRLSSSFRAQLDAEDSDTIEKVLQLFAKPPTDTLDRLLSPDVGALLGGVNALRNEWLGHAGATTREQAADQLAGLVERTDQLRDSLGTVWDDYRLVRAGRMARRDGKYHVEVEVATGPTAPFIREELVLDDALDDGGLYLTVIDGEQALKLLDFVVLRPAPRSANYTCYFYSRREAEGVRMISYQYAEENSVIDDLPSVDSLLAGMAGGTGIER